MGITRQDFIVYGWKLAYDSKLDIFSDKFLPYIEGHPGIKYTLVSDGMCGEYNVFGRLISMSNDEGWDFVELEVKSVDDFSEATKNEYRLLFDMDPPSEPKLLIFSHLS